MFYTLHHVIYRALIHMDLAFGGYCNMALIEKSDIATLKSSTEVAEVAKSAKLILEEMSVAS